MAEQTSSSIVIGAPPDAVMAVIADFGSYPEWTGAVKETHVVEPGGQRARRVRFVLDAGPIKDEYTLVYDWHDDASVTWTLVDGSFLKSMNGAYVLVPVDGGATEVTYRLQVDVSIPIIGLLRRRAEKVVIDTALTELKRRVEAC
jgi:ribosome-associated toxin RatA of RatAB toxin-antitoxin module